ncbi:hypothetical protein JCM8547_001162 [Rhodosporidiobolus lusitaniae]
MSSLRSLSSTSSRFSPPQQLPLLLKDLRQLLARYPLVDATWTERLERAAGDLKQRRSARVAVVGDHDSGAEGVVTALLDDPLASSPDVTVALESRRLRPDTPEAVVIKYGEESKASASEVELPSSWLKENKAEVIEVVHGDGIPPLESSFTSLHLSDGVVLVLSDSTLLSAPSAQTVLYNLSSKPNLFLALNASDASSSASSSPLQHQLESLFRASTSSPHPPETIVVSTQQALAALEALNPSEPNKPADYEAFQRGYLSSSIPALSSLLSASVSSHSSAVPSPLQLQTASYILLSALHRAAFSGAQIADSLSSASSSLSALSQHAEERSLSLLSQLGVDPSSGLLKVPHDELHTSLKAVDELLLNRLAWYKLPYRVDDLHAELSLLLSHSYLPHFERTLVYSSGLAQSLSTLLSSRVDTLLSSPLFALSPTQSALSPSQKLASLHSPTLLNRVAQAAQTAAQGFTPSALSASLIHRRNQITSPGGPVDALQRRAQKAVFQSGVLSLASVLGAGASQALEWAEAAVNVGYGALGVTVGAWWLQSRWEKAKKRFRKDLGERVTGGLEEDLGIAARRLVDRSLFKTRTAVALADELVQKKQREFEAFRTELSRIEQKRVELEKEIGGTEVGVVGEEQKEQ